LPAHRLQPPRYPSRLQQHQRNPFEPPRDHATNSRHVCNKSELTNTIATYDHIMSAEEQSLVPSLTDSRRAHASLHNGLEIQQPTLQRLEREAEPNASLRGNRHSLPPDFLLPNIRSTDTSVSSSPHHAQDTGQPLDEATIANRTAALRRLNGIAPRHRRAESTRTRTSLSSQPIIVRTYSASPTSRPPSDPRVSATMYDRRSMTHDLNLPSAEVFSFENILQAIEHEAQDDVDAIAEICGRSKMSLANEYDAHMPPQGELMAARIGGQPSSMARSSLNQSLTPVEEASSINERLGGNTPSIYHDTNDVHEHPYNVTSNGTNRPRDSDIAGSATCRQASITRDYASGSASPSILPTATPTKAQQKVLEQSTLPVMLFSDAALRAQGTSTTTLRYSKTQSKPGDLLVSGKADLLIEQEVSKDPQAPNKEPLSREVALDSNQRQAPLLGSLPPWLSWTNRSSLPVDYGTKSSGISAASSLRCILATKGNQERAEARA